MYRSPDGKAALDVRLDRETVWLNQREMAELFVKDTDTVGLHIRNIYNEGELTRKGTTEESTVIQNEGGGGFAASSTFAILNTSDQRPESEKWH